MNIVKSLSTPVSYLININDLGLVDAARAHLNDLSLGEIILITQNFTNSSNLNQIGEVKLELIKKKIQETEEYKLIEKII